MPRRWYVSSSESKRFSAAAGFGGPGRSGLVGLAVAGALILGCSAKGSKNGHGNATPEPRRFTLFATGEIKGTIEPCGCTTDPLGDLARTTALVTSARAGGGVLYLDAGSMLFTHNPIPPELEAQEELKAKLLLGVFRDQLDPDGVGLGPFDLSRGPKAVQPPRLAANVPISSGIAVDESKIVRVAGVSVGLFGVVSPAAVESLGIHATDPVEAARKATGDLKKKGAELVVGIAHMTKAEARSLAGQVDGIDVLIVGQNLPDPDRLSAGPDRVGTTWLVSPANRGQVVSRLDITMRGQGPLGDAIGEARAKVEIESLEQRITDIQDDLARWKKDPSADKAFVAQKARELEALKEQAASLAKQPLVVPPTGPYFVMDQVEISKQLPCNTDVVAKKSAFDSAAGAANLAAAKDDKPRPPAKGEAGYVGSEECSYCHAKAVEFWKHTKHAQAWETLVHAGKQYNRDCIYCHVTGFGQPGGSTLAYTENLRDVQCEVCHGPGSLHVAADGNDQPRTIVRAPPAETCKSCHTKEHSDTFELQAYLRDVTGEGHGADFRARLGDGPTGHELRQAGLAKAGKSIGAGCPK